MARRIQSCRSSGRKILVDALKRTNAEAKLTIYPEALHDSWSATYDNPEIYEWLLAQTRGAKP